MYKVRDINWNDPKYVRAGIIPIVEQNGMIFFGMSVSNNVVDIGDFGGHRESLDKDCLDTAIREYREESLNVFGEVTRESLQNNYVLDGVDTIEILLPVPGPFYKYTEQFNYIVGNNKDHEIQSVVWLSRRQLLICVGGYETNNIYIIYDKIKNVIHNNRHLI